MMVHSSNAPNSWFRARQKKAAKSSLQVPMGRWAFGELQPGAYQDLNGKNCNLNPCTSMWNSIVPTDILTAVPNIHFTIFSFTFSLHFLALNYYPSTTNRKHSASSITYCSQCLLPSSQWQNAATNIYTDRLHPPAFLGPFFLLRFCNTELQCANE